MKIEKFNLILDEANFSVSLLVNVDTYHFNDIKNETVKYKIDIKNNTLIFYAKDTQSTEIEFRLNEEIISFAFKSINIPIIVHSNYNDDILFIINTELE